SSRASKRQLLKPIRTRASWRRRRPGSMKRFFPPVAPIHGSRLRNGRSIGRPQTIGVPTNAEILFDRRRAAVLVPLNPPPALKSVTHERVGKLAQMLAAWADDGAVPRVVVTAAGERAFSAGGDLRAIYELRRAGRIDEALAYWRDEYRLNALIKH